MTIRISMLLIALGLLAASGQLVATHWGVPGEAVGSLLAGVILLLGWRAFAPELHLSYLLPLIAIASSLFGLLLAVAGSAESYTPILWAIALLAAFPTGVPALWTQMRGAECHLCRRSLRRILYFSCPRCKLIACEYCWEFERDRCHLCATNQVPLFPAEAAWWKMHFGSQVYEGRCALCLRTPDWRISHWPCRSCGHTQCRLCWDDNNGQCSRCAWTIPSPTMDRAQPISAERRDNELPHDKEESRAQVPDVFRHSAR